MLAHCCAIFLYCLGVLVCFIQSLKNIRLLNKCILVVHLFSFPSQEVPSSLKSCDWCRRQSLSCLFSTNGSAMKALEARCCYFLSVVSCCFLFNRCFSLFFIQSLFVLYSIDAFRGWLYSEGFCGILLPFIIQLL